LAAFGVFEEYGLRASVIKAVEAAVERAYQLGQ
jgi:pyrroline-5-carboxylate reductase